MSNLDTKKDKRKLLIFFILTFLSIIITFWRIGFGVSFWIVMSLWCIIFMLFFVRPIFKIAIVFWLAIIVTFTLSMLISFNVIFKNDSSSTSKTVLKSDDGIILAECTSTASDMPKMLDGWKSTIYAAKLNSTSPDISEGNNVRIFSYKGIQDKTEINSLYSRIEKADGSYITGFGTTMEVCDDNNKTTKSYVTLDTDYVASENVVASTHYLHGGKYLHGAGNYRADIYIKTPDSKWHLVDRMSGITATE